MPWRSRGVRLFLRHGAATLTWKKSLATLPRVTKVKRRTHPLRFPFLILDIDPDSFALHWKGAQPKNPRQWDPVPSLWPGNPRLLLPRLYLGGTQRSGDHPTFPLCSKTIKICLSKRVFPFASNSNEKPTRPRQTSCQSVWERLWLTFLVLLSIKKVFFYPEAENSGERKSLNVLSGSLACNGVWLDRQRTHPRPGETLRAQRLVILGFCKRSTFWKSALRFKSLHWDYLRLCRPTCSLDKW